MLFFLRPDQKINNWSLLNESDTSPVLKYKIVKCKYFKNSPEVSLQIQYEKLKDYYCSTGLLKACSNNAQPILVPLHKNFPSQRYVLRHPVLQHVSRFFFRFVWTSQLWPPNEIKTGEPHHHWIKRLISHTRRFTYT